MIDRFRRHHRLISYLVLALAIIAMASTVLRQSQWADYNLCRSSQANRQALRDVIVQATEETGGGGLDLTAIPSFPALDPEMQQYLRELEAAINQPPPEPTGESDTDRLLALVPLEDCGHLRPWP